MGWKKKKDIGSIMKPRKYLISNDIMLAISKSNQYEIYQ